MWRTVFSLLFYMHAINSYVQADAQSVIKLKFLFQYLLCFMFVNGYWKQNAKGHCP